MPLSPEPDLDGWSAFVDKLKNPKREVRIGLIGKYVELKDAYKSIAESFIHAAVSNDCSVELVRIHSENINEDNVAELLGGLNGVLVAPGFGERGVEGKITAIKYARENGVPFFGICLGMQCAVIEFARNVLGLEDAHSTEIDPETSNPVIDIMEAQKKVTVKGGTMRLGVYDCKLADGSRAKASYQEDMVNERHRHRFEFNNDYLADFEKSGMQASGINPDGSLVEIIELQDHPWFVGVQFHPEYKSTVANPHPFFVHFVKAAVELSETIAN
jgi:CTP synthase